MNPVRNGLNIQRNTYKMIYYNLNGLNQMREFVPLLTG